MWCDFENRETEFLLRGQGPEYKTLFLKFPARLMDVLQGCALSVRGACSRHGTINIQVTHGLRSVTSVTSVTGPSATQAHPPTVFMYIYVWEHGQNDQIAWITLLALPYCNRVPFGPI